MEMTSYEHGVPSWVDIGVPDVDAAVAFYSGLFGWSIDEGPEEAGGYRMCMLRDRPVAGLGPQQSPDMPPFWATYVNVDDAGAVTDKVKGAGGTVIVEPMDVMGFGTMAVYQDDIGAFVSVWQPGMHTGAGIVNEPGTLGWNELLTTDLDASIAFYEAVFGWGHDTQGPEGNQYTEWKVGGRSIGGCMLKGPMMPAEVPPHWAVYFIVDDVDASAARVAELGGTVLMPGTDIEPGRFAVVMDPGGATFNLFKTKAGLGD